MPQPSPAATAAQLTLLNASESLSAASKAMIADGSVQPNAMTLQAIAFELIASASELTAT